MSRQIPGRIPFGRILFSPDDGISNIGSASAAIDTDVSEQTQTPANTPQRKAVQELINAIVNSKRVNGDPAKALEVFAGQVLAKEARIAELAKGAGELPAEVQARLAAYEALGTPEELVSKLAETEQLGATAMQLQREKTIGECASLLKINAGPLLQTLLKDVELHVEGDGEDRHVTVREGEADIGWDEYVATRADLQAALPALAVGAQGRAPAPLMGVSDRVAGPPNPVDAHLERLRKSRAAKTNPLQPVQG